MDPKDIEKLAKILRDQGDKILTCEFKFTLTGWFNGKVFVVIQLLEIFHFAFRRSAEKPE